MTLIKNGKALVKSNLSLVKLSKGEVSMNDNEYLAGIIRDQLGRQLPLVTASIVSLQGSSPRHRGARIVISSDSRSYGTIGGGLLEAAVIKECLTAMEQKQSRFMHFELTDNGADSSGMICGDKATILLDYIEASPANLEFYEMWCEVISSGKNSYLLTSIKNTEGQIKITGRSILFPDGHTAGANILSIAEIENIRTEIHNISNTSIFDFPDKQVIVDAVRRLKTMYCFGAGHVAVPTARIAAMTGFRVVVIDDRAEFACAERFSEADEVRVIEKFECAFDRLKIDADSFIVIATRGHMFDKVVLEQALQTRAGYIGMISSRKKLSSIYEALMAGGASKESLERVHSPIGIKIGGDTPEEIAVSIIAELISERSRQQGSG